MPTIKKDYIPQLSNQKKLQYSKAVYHLSITGKQLLLFQEKKKKNDPQLLADVITTNCELFPLAEQSWLEVL